MTPLRRLELDFQSNDFHFQEFFSHRLRQPILKLCQPTKVDSLISFMGSAWDSLVAVKKATLVTSCGCSYV